MNRKVFILLCFSICFISCNKKNESNNQTNVQTEDVLIVNSSNNTIIFSDNTDKIVIKGDNNQVSSESSKDNVNITNSELYKNHTDNYLNEFFLNKKYSTKNSGLENIYLSYIERDNTQLVTKGIIYSQINYEIQPLFFIDEYIIKDKDFNQISYPISTQEFYGWKIEFYKKSIDFQIFTNQGKNTTDPIIFNWNEKDKKYEVFRINPLDL